ncbi:MAG: hypothetical protein IPK72_10580 [Candidatus Eisenbacteria bacterium]|nr:hypothetical protein [Candidatus Eisenbacteria bacterium]
MLRLLAIVLVLACVLPAQAVSSEFAPSPRPSSWNHDSAGDQSVFRTQGHSHVTITCTRGSATVKIGETYVGIVNAGEGPREFTILPGEATIEIQSDSFGGSAGTVRLPGQ